MGRQIVEGNSAIPAENHHHLNHIGQFADVSRPRIFFHAVQNGRVDPDGSFAFLEFSQKIMRQERDVRQSFPQRRNCYRNDAQAIIKILTKISLFHFFFKASIRGGKNAHIHLDRPVVPDPFELFFLDDPQEDFLQVKRNLSDFIEDESTPMSGLETADRFLDGAGEGPFGVAEKFAGKESIGQGAARDRDQRLLFPLAVVMNRFGDQVLSRCRSRLESEWFYRS